MASDSVCVFCEIIKDHLKASLIYHDEFVSVFMDIRPLTPGHLLVVPNRHITDLSGLNEETGAHLLAAGRQAAAALRGSGLRCEGVNLFLADGVAAGQTVFHLHLHVIPRFGGDGFGFVHAARVDGTPAREELDLQAGRIREAWGG